MKGLIKKIAAKIKKKPVTPPSSPVKLSAYEISKNLLSAAYADISPRDTTPIVQKPIEIPVVDTSTKTEEGHHYFVVIRGTFHTSCSVHSTHDDRAYIEELVKNRFIADMGKQDLFPVVTSMEVTEEN